MNKKERISAEKILRRKYKTVKNTLTERGRRLFVASEAIAIGYGGVAIAARATGMAASAIGRGKEEVYAIEGGTAPVLEPCRSRRPGAGRKKAEDKDPKLLPELKKLLEATTRGDPESPLLWTARSLNNILEALKVKGHFVSQRTLSRLLKDLGYSLQANSKTKEGAHHPDRNVQFEHINEMIRRQEENQEPSISVDTKKRELVGPYANKGVELRPKKSPEEVAVHDFGKEKVSPYGVYDLRENEAWVSVGISHDTSEFAVQSIRTWWSEMGQKKYRKAKSLLITADCGGSNGYRVRLWKWELQQLADDLGLTIVVCHLPPGTSKWNKIEHRLFSFITKNWRGKPLATHQVIVELIRATKTSTGLRVQSQLDDKHYAKGRRITDKEMARIHLEPHEFHGEWNYSIHPSKKAA